MNYNMGINSSSSSNQGLWSWTGNCLSCCVRCKTYANDSTYLAFIGTENKNNRRQKALSCDLSWPTWSYTGHPAGFFIHANMKPVVRKGSCDLWGVWNLFTPTSTLYNQLQHVPTLPTWATSVMLISASRTSFKCTKQAMYHAHTVHGGKYCLQDYCCQPRSDKAVCSRDRFNFSSAYLWLHSGNIVPISLTYTVYLSICNIQRILLTTVEV